jgi:putative membrane protein
MRIIVFITGFLMALADSVPGVSGGTIAFVLGVYQELIDSIKNLTNKDKAIRKAAILFVINIGITWVIGAVLAVLVLTALFETHIYLLSSIFIGFIFVSIPITMQDDKKEMLENKHHFFYTIIGIIIVVAFAYLGTKINIDASSTTEIGLLGYVYIFLTGMLAIGCMLLPGISGSTMLMITGVYFLIMNSVESFLKLDFTVFPILFVFGMGILVGGFFSVKLISYVYKNYRTQTVYTIEGLMIGSLYAIVVGPTSLDLDPLSFDTFSIIGFIFGAILILGLEKIKHKKQ